MNARGLFCLGFFLLSAFLPLGAPAYPSATSLQAKHSAFTGWKFGDGTFKTLDTTDTITYDYGAGVTRVERTLRIGLVYRSDVSYVEQRQTFSSGFTGNIFWTSNPNGMTVPSPPAGDAAKFGLAVDLVFTDAVAGLPWEITGTTQVDGASCDVVHVEQANAFPIDLYVDDATGAYKRIVIDPGGPRESSIDVLSYGDAVPGKKIVTKWKYAESTATHTVTKIAANTPISNEQLHPPPQTASWVFSNPQPFRIKVSAYRFIVDATVNGVPGKFILDTGSYDVLLSDDFAQRAKIKELGHGESGGIAGGLKQRTGLATIQVGGNTLSNVMVSYGGKALDPDAPDGLLGFDLLGAAIVTLDIAGGTMQIQDPASFDQQALSGVRVLVDLSSLQPSVPMKINGVAPVNATLDSGSPAHVLFAPQIVSKYGLRMLVDNSMIGYYSSHVGVGGVGGGFELDECGYLDSVALGPIVYDHAPACKSRSFRGDNALIGFDFLKGFSKITFGYPQSWIVFTPNPNAQ
jgi:hypothetical protein